MQEKKPFMVGNIRLSDLNGFEDTAKGGVRGCFIPYEANPSLYVGQNRQTGAFSLDLDILVRETSNSKTGSSHFIKLNVGKANRERFHLSQEAADSLKIVGNLYTRTPAFPAQGVQRPDYRANPGGARPSQRRSAPAGNVGFDDDLPESSFGGQNAGW